MTCIARGGGNIGLELVVGDIYDGAIIGLGV